MAPENGREGVGRPSPPPTASLLILSLDHATGLFTMATGGPMNEMVMCWMLDLADQQRLKMRSEQAERMVQPASGFFVPRTPKES